MLRFHFLRAFVVLLAFVTSEITLGVTTEPSAVAEKVARVKIPLKLVSYEKALVKDKNGKDILKAKPVHTAKIALRSTVDRVNHFYAGSWHIEVIPVNWSAPSKSYKARLKFYRRYGDSKEVEEYVGYSDFQSKLEGSDFVYLANGFKQSSFKDKSHHNILDVAIGFQNPNEKVKYLSKK
ncbi:MAG: hypothetical protein AB7T49_08340 [Oligoflexales bacterium]